MKNNDYQHLIQSLASDLKPVHVHWSPEKRALLVTFFHIIWVVALMYFIRPFSVEVLHYLYDPIFLVEILLFIFSLFLTSYFSFLSLVPGAMDKKYFRYTLIPLTLLILFFLCGLPERTVHSHDGMRSLCDLEILIYALPILAHFIYFKRKGVYQELAWPMAYSAFTSTLIPATLMHFVCAYDYRHILIFHMGPVFLTVGLSLLVIKSKKLKSFFKG